MVNSDTASESDWKTLPDGSRSLFVEVESQGALGLRLHIERLTLPGGSRLLISDAANAAASSVSVSQADADSQGGLWTATVFSQQVRVECRVPAGVALKDVAFEITGVSHIYTLPAFAPASADAPNTKEGTCHLDVTCSPDYAQQASGVARMSFVDNGDTLLCTGCLLSTDSTSNDSFFLTANHCITDQSLASTIELFWLYQTAVCHGTPPALTNVPQTSGGADLLANSSASDFSFLRLRQAPPDGTTALDWSTNRPSTSETLACIHHPGGTYKRISFGTFFNSDVNFWAVRWSRGVTEPGSSGGPLLNGAHQVIGQLNGGFAGPGSSCGNPSAPDQFGRFDVTYQAIQSWLGGGSGTNPIVTGNSVMPNKGTFTGLFGDQAAVSPRTAGYVTITTTASGKFSGNLQTAGGRYGFKGQFGSDGTAQTQVLRGALRGVTLQLQGDGDSGGDSIIGTVSDGTSTATLAADRAVFDGRGSVAPQSGQYTFAFQGSAAANSPIGNSVGVVTVTRAGKIQFVGSLADGTRVSQATSISAAGNWPLYAALYHGSGLVWGPMSFTGSDTSDVSGNVSWVKLASLRTKFFKSGFTLDSNVTGSRYTPQPRGVPLLGQPNATLVLQGDDSGQVISDPITFGPNNHVTDLNGNKLSLSFSPAFGSFTGKLSSPGNFPPATLRGVVLQKQNMGSGYYLTAVQAGQVLLQP